MQDSLRTALEETLGDRVVDMRALAGGDINQAYEVGLKERGSVFLKTHPDAPIGMYACEARGLQWLRQAESLRLPEVVAVRDSAAVEPRFLVLEMLRPGRRLSDFDERLGRGLAALHRTGAERFGLDHDNFIARLPQENEPSDDWPTFYAERRLRPQLRMAVDAGVASNGLKREVERVIRQIGDYAGPAEPPARLHGDLWGGNLHTDPVGAPCLIDPAAYAGHREVDLAMMRLFGGFSARCFAAYNEAYPLADGARERVPLYQLYPLLVHVNLFGSGYVGSAERAAKAVR